MAGVDDRPLTAGDIRAVTNATTCVTDWSTMGIELDIPIEVINKSERDSRRITNDQQRILLTYWLESGNASWAALVNALRSPLVAKGGQANKIAKEHPKVAGTSGSTGITRTPGGTTGTNGGTGITRTTGGTSGTTGGTSGTTGGTSGATGGTSGATGGTSEATGGSQSGNDIMKKSPDKYELFDLIRDNSSRWPDFARELRISNDTRTSLSHDISLTNPDRLDEVLRCWIEEEPEEAPVTWEYIIKVLANLKLKNVAKIVLSHLRKPDVIQKYETKPVFSPFELP